MLEPLNHVIGTRNNKNILLAASSGPPQSCMVTCRAALDPNNDRFYVLNRHFSDTIFNTFFTGHFVELVVIRVFMFSICKLLENLIFDDFSNI